MITMIIVNMGLQYPSPNENWNTAFIKINTTVAFKEGLLNMCKIIIFQRVWY